MTNRNSGYCRHGVYVGGCGIDWMCGACESGITVREEKDQALRNKPKGRVILNGKALSVQTYREALRFFVELTKEPAITAKHTITLEKYYYDRERLVTQTFR